MLHYVLGGSESTLRSLSGDNADGIGNRDDGVHAVHDACNSAIGLG
jgi:hypothetical protein